MTIEITAWYPGLQDSLRTQDFLKYTVDKEFFRIIRQWRFLVCLSQKNRIET